MTTNHSAHEVTLEPVEPADRVDFMRDLQAAFAVAVTESFGFVPNEPVPSDADVAQSFEAPGAAIYHIVAAGRRVGGAVVVIDEQTQRNALDLFFIATAEHGRGWGYRAWQAIEARYPDTRVWETHTPYFEKRNIHFYVNKCGFRIVEFYNARNPDPHSPTDSQSGDGDGDMFRFEKRMPARP